MNLLPFIIFITLAELCYGYKHIIELQGHMKFGEDKFFVGYRITPRSCNCEYGCLVIYDGYSATGESIWSYPYFGDDKFCTKSMVSLKSPLESHLDHYLEISVVLYKKDNCDFFQEKIYLFVERIIN